MVKERVREGQLPVADSPLMLELQEHLPTVTATDPPEPPHKIPILPSYPLSDMHTYEAFPDTKHHIATAPKLTLHGEERLQGLPADTTLSSSDLEHAPSTETGVHSLEPLNRRMDPVDYEMSDVQQSVSSPATEQ